MQLEGLARVLFQVPPSFDPHSPAVDQEIADRVKPVAQVTVGPVIQTISKRDVWNFFIERYRHHRRLW